MPFEILVSVICMYKKLHNLITFLVQSCFQTKFILNMVVNTFHMRNLEKCVWNKYIIVFTNVLRDLVLEDLSCYVLFKDFWTDHLETNFLKMIVEANNIKQKAGLVFNM